MNILAELRSRFESALRSLTDEPDEYVAMVKPAQGDRFGDFQANCAMPLAKKIGCNPRELAAEIVANLDVSDLCTDPQVAGPGFINLSLRDDWLEAATGRLLSDAQLGVEPTRSPRTYVVDYSGPNIAKPMHVGHLRSTVIGDALCRLLQYVGHKVIGDNHIGDWGTQFGMILVGYKNFLDEDAYRNDSVGELARLYRLVNQLSDYHAATQDRLQLANRLADQEAEIKAAEESADANDQSARKAIGRLRSELAETKAKIAANDRVRASVEGDPHLKQRADAHPEIAAEARRETAKLHAGDEENFRLWEQFLPACLDALRAVYDRLDIHFDEELGESFYRPLLSEVVEDLVSRGIARESEGALCVFLEDNEAPFIVRKGDGAFTYATTDLATIRHRAERFKADAMLYVVDARQSEHFKLLFATARRWGYGQTEFRHIRFGKILGDDRRPFKTRSGDTVGLESLLDEAVARAREIVDDNDDAKAAPELDDMARAEVAEAVGIGGIKYADLRHNRDSDYVFSWEKMLAKNGDTATYMQYSYARICGIFRKGNIDVAALRDGGGTIRFTQPEERSLALQLNRFAEHVESAAGECRPNILTHSLFETANSFSTFYENCPVLKEDVESVRTSRLLLCDLTARVLGRGLSLLGIHTCEKM